MMKKYFAWLLIVCCTLFGVTSRAQTWPPLGRDPNFSHLMMEQGQTVGEVLAIAQDSRGFIWIGGRNGLARYDGYRFNIYMNNAKDPNSLGSNYVRDIFLDSHGELWVATQKGVVRYNHQLDNFVRCKYAEGSYRGRRSEAFYRIIEDSHQNLWFVGYNGVGIYSRERNELSEQLRDSDLKKSVVTGMAQASEDEYAITSTGGLFYWNRRTGELSQFTHDEKDPNGLPTNNLNQPLVDSYHNIWVAHEKGISLFTPANRKFDNIVIPNLVTGALGTSVRTLFEDKRRILWLASDGNGLMYLDPASRHMGSYTASASPSSLSHSVVRRIFQDNNGDFWIGMFPIGVNHFDRNNNSISLYSNFLRDKNGLFRNQVWAFLDEGDGNMWLGMDNMGVVYFDRTNHSFTQNYKGVDFSSPVFPRSVLSLLKDSHDNLWFGSWGQGIGRLNLKTLRCDLFKESQKNSRSIFPAQNVWRIFEAHNGIVYFATAGDGFITYDYHTNEFIRHVRDVSMPDDKVLLSNNLWYFYEDESENIWMATSEGVQVYDPRTQTFTNFRNDPADDSSLSNNLVSSLIKDSKGRLWVSTMGGGLDLYHPDTRSFTHLRAEDGLSNDGVHGAIEDRHGKLWISTRTQLNAYDPETHQLTGYNESNWLQRGEFDTGAMLKLKTGELAFGGVGGFNIFDPDKISRDTSTPPIYFTEFQLYGKAVAINASGSPLTRSILDSDAITLNYDQAVFSLAFTSLNYRNYASTRYRYMLEGFDKRWREATADNRATYTHMDAGTYVFRVQASSQPDVWNGNDKQLIIIVRPAPWRTWWAYALYTALLLSIAGWYLHLQRQKIRDTNLLNSRLIELDKIKDEFMANTSHELRTPVNGIIGMTQALREDDSNQLSASGREKIDIIQACGRRLARLVNDILDFSSIKKQQSRLNLSCVDIAPIIADAITECEINYANASIQVQNSLPADLPLACVDHAKVATIFYNVIANAYKFTEKGLIKISSVPSEDKLCIEVADTGVGIEAKHLYSIFTLFEQVADSGVRQKNGTGLGLAVCKHLVELHGGTITVRSTRGVGSVFTITLPRATPQQVAEHQRNLESERKAKIVAIKPGDDESVSHAEQKFLTVFYPRNYPASATEGSRTVMVVDDEPVNRMVLRHLLLKRNHVVLEAANGLEAVDALEKGCKCDLVLMDIMMPVMSGVEACQRVRQRFSIEALPIIFVTAKTQQQDRDACAYAGGNAFLTKPVVADELFASMSQVFACKIA